MEGLRTRLSRSHTRVHRAHFWTILEACQIKPLASVKFPPAVWRTQRNLCSFYNHMHNKFSAELLLPLSKFSCFCKSGINCSISAALKLDWKELFMLPQSRSSHLAFRSGDRLTCKTHYTTWSQANHYSTLRPSLLHGGGETAVTGDMAHWHVGKWRFTADASRSGYKSGPQKP